MNRLLCAAGLVLLAGAARGDPPPGVKTIRLVLHPAAPPSPALRYPLLPELRQQEQGNAVPVYRCAVMTMKDARSALADNQWPIRLDGWRETPLDRLPRERVRADLLPFAAALRQAEDAARHEYADWKLTDKLRKQGIAVLLNDVQEMRQLATLFAVRTRLAIADDRLDDAVRDLQTMFAIARHVSQSPTLISALVGMGTFGVGAQQAEELLQHPAAPNLYWSLADLPQPFIDLRTAFQGERIMAYGSFPGLPTSPLDAHKPLTPEQAEQLGKVLVGLQFDEPSPLRLPVVAYKIRIAQDMQHKHEKAKQALVEAGWPRDAVEKMPHIQVGVLHGLLEYERRMDEAIKWGNFPYWQAVPALMDLEKRRGKPDRQTGPDEPALPIADVFLAGSGRILFRRTQVERKIAALRCLEAVRLYAARHDGKLPARLDAIKEVPVPADPFTGKPFEYTAAGERATLYAAAIAPPIPGRAPNPQEALSYEIVLKR